MPPDFTNPCCVGRQIVDGHLGGTAEGGDPDSYFPELWAWLVQTYGVRSVLDVGCGLGYAQQFFESLGVEADGVDGCREVCDLHLTKRAFLHDFVNGPWSPSPARRYDLVWSCEFVEHVEERYLGHLLETFRENAGKVLALTAAPPGAGGHHHVNCRPREYWVGHLTNAGFTYDEASTATARAMAPDNRNGRARSYFARGGMIFTVSETAHGP